VNGQRAALWSRDNDDLLGMIQTTTTYHAQQRMLHIKNTDKQTSKILVWIATTTCNLTVTTQTTNC